MPCPAQRTLRVPIARWITLVLTSSALFPVTAGADPGDAVLSGKIEVGGRSVSGDPNAARLLEYRDLRDGLVGDIDLRLDRDRDYLRARSQNAGWDDQRYWLEAGRRGVFAVDFFYGELPHVFSTRARSPFVRTASDTFSLPAGAQATIAGASDRSAALTSLLETARPVPLELRWIEGRAGFEAWLGDRLRLESDYRIQDRHGTRNFAANFGSPGGSFVSIAGPVDDRIHELRTAAEFLPRPGSTLRLEYVGSFYENDLESLTIANPLVASDAPNAASAARSSVDPDNAAHQISLVASSELPVGFPARWTGSLAYGLRLQNDRFLPHTRNPTILDAGLALPRGRLDGEVHTWAAQFALSAKPTPRTHADLHARLYDYDNRTDDLSLPARVRNDDSLVTSPRLAVRSDYRVYEVEAEVGFDVRDDLRADFAYDWEYWQRSKDRNVEDLHEHGPGFSLRWRPTRRAQLRAEYAFHTRRGSDYDAFAFFRADAPGALDPVEASTLEFARLRRPDQANRDAHDARLVAALEAHSNLHLRLDGSLRHEDYLDSDYGLRERRQWSVGAETTWQIHPRATLGSFYTFEKSAWIQRSRWRPRNFVPPPATLVIDDPSNDWRSRTRDRFHNIGATLDLVLLQDRLDARVGYLLQWGRQKQRATTPPGSVVIGGAPGDDATNWPTIEDRLQAVTAELDYRWSDSVTLSFGYRFEKMDVDDFRVATLGPAPIPGDSTLDVYLGDTRGDADVHVAVFRIAFRLQPGIRLAGRRAAGR